MTEELEKLKIIANKYPLIKLDITSKNETDWESTVTTCDLIVAPYSPEVYATCGSAITCEAFVHDIPIIASANTSMSSYLDKFNLGELIVTDYSEGGFLDAIKYVFKNIERIRLQFSAASALWNQQNDSLPYAKAVLQVLEMMDDKRS